VKTFAAVEATEAKKSFEEGSISEGGGDPL